MLDVDIILAILVASWAMRFLRVVRASCQIDSMRHGLQVPRINTSSRSTQMVKFQVCWDGAKEKFISNAMSKIAHTFWGMKISMAFLVSAGCPKPASKGRTLINFDPEAFLPGAHIADLRKGVPM